jgi:hypothetical protein
MHNPVATISQTLLIAAISLLVICLPLSNSTVLINGIQTAKSFNIHNMAPGKFYPLYLLAKLYDASGQQHKAIAMANTILNKEVKGAFNSNRRKLANIKAFAIANAEIPKETLDCWEEVNEDGNGPLTHKTYCGDCKAILGRTFLYKSTCTP